MKSNVLNVKRNSRKTLDYLCKTNDKCNVFDVLIKMF